MATQATVTGDLMAGYIESINATNARILRTIATHIQECYADPVKYQAALGEIALMILEQQQPLKEAWAIVEANNGKKQRYK